jgi:preprotein translocase SecE subunit
MAEEKKSFNVLNILKKEYPFEGILLGLLGTLVLVLGVYIFEGEVLEVRLTEWWIFDAPWKIITFSFIIMAIGAAALIYAIAPFFIPGLKEMNKVSWPTRSMLNNYLARVFGFLLIVAVMFILYDLVFVPLFNFLYQLGA